MSNTTLRMSFVAGKGFYNSSDFNKLSITTLMCRNYSFSWVIFYTCFLISS